MMYRIISLLLLSLAWSSALADEAPASRAHYLANGGVMIERGETRILFDPLFRNDYDQYDRLPPEMEAALFAGSAPFNGIDAVFVSHHHDDHFDPALMLEFLNAHSNIQFFAPRQAVTALQALVADPADAVLDRVHSISLEFGDSVSVYAKDELLIEAVRIPHAGWPTRNASVENIVFRVTLDEATTVMHFGDADPSDEYFAKNAGHWHRRATDLALPPFWFFLSDAGRSILADRVKAGHAVGVHVPTRMPDDATQRPTELQNFDLFTRPGESREISASPAATP
jgi:L-ascorbate metabolism protein UlaG (beta-lactamase superfamily)